MMIAKRTHRARPKSRYARGPAGTLPSRYFLRFDAASTMRMPMAAAVVNPMVANM